MPSKVDFTNCPVATALDAIGERWTILILRNLTLNKSQRFQDLQDSLKGCAPNTLSARLKALEDRGLIERRQYEAHPPRFEYVLTDKGRGASPVLKALRAWGTQLQALQPPEAETLPAERAASR
jgi:DNA-binding HxlR family transcriptional regulator